MQNSKRLFSNDAKECEYCGKTLPAKYKESVCPNCLELQLFSHVKEYIRSHDVNEYEVASHFEIPLHQVKEWIKEGRIEYKEPVNGPAIKAVYCQKCGVAITFGMICPKCLKSLNKGKGHSSTSPFSEHDASKMHYLDE